MPDDSGRHIVIPTRTGIAAVPKSSSYKRGAAPTTNPSMGIAAKSIRPSHLDNKCLVVSKINFSTTKEDFKSYVNMIAKKKLTYSTLRKYKEKILENGEL